MPSKLTIDLAGKTGDPIGAAVAAGLKLVKFEGTQQSEMDADELARHGLEALVYRPCLPGGSNLYETAPADDFNAAIPDKLIKCQVPKRICEADNEPLIKTLAQAQRYREFMRRFVQLVHARGGLVAGFSWSTGNPTSEILANAEIMAVLAEIASWCDVHAFHVYYTRARGWADLEQVWAFERALPASARRPVVLTECSLDETGDRGTGGYHGKISDEEFLAVMRALDAILLAHPEVLAATMYVWGGDWWSFWIDSVFPRLFVPYIAAQGGGAPIQWTGPVDPPATEPPIYELTVDKPGIAAGETVRVSWYIEHIRAAWLDNQPITGPRGSKDVALTATHNFVLDVHLIDGQEACKIVTVTVQPVVKPPPPTRFVGPPNDNGRGFSFGLDNRTDKLIAHLPEIAALGTKWVIFPNVGDELQAAECARRTWALGMMPVIRLQAKIDAGFPNWSGAVKAILAAGVPAAWVQIFNEPGDPREWQSGRYDRAKFVQRWHDAAVQVIEAGGLAGLQSLDKGDIQQALLSLTPEQREHVFLVSHSYASNHPPNYPYDKGLTIFEDDTCALRWLEEAEWAKEILGDYPQVIVGEGGYAIDQQEDRTYPRTTEDLFALGSVAIFDWFRGQLVGVPLDYAKTYNVLQRLARRVQRRLGLGKRLRAQLSTLNLPTPSWFRAYCMWLWYDADYQGFTWRGQRLKAIDAVKAMPPFVRDDEEPPPPPPPPPDDTTLDRVRNDLGQLIIASDNMGVWLRRVLADLEKL